MPRQGRTVYDELADSIRDLVHQGAREASPPVQRAKVLRADPLTVEMLDDDLVLEEGDPDVEIDRALLVTRPAVGDTVRVHHDGEDWIIAGVLVADATEVEA